MTIEDTFQHLTGNSPFPWQTVLYNRFVGDCPDNIPSSANLPTGLGKTSVVAVWLLALAQHPDRVPRRLVYVVNRRTVVDQTTNEVENYRAKLQYELALNAVRDKLAALCALPLRDRVGKPVSPLALSTLRGQFADNREWSADPTRPAVIVGTVDMIGSRLLFSGYGVGFKGKPLHAGFLGQDVLLVHDEAHLEPAFQKLLIAIENEQKRCKEFARFRVMELSATTRTSDNHNGTDSSDPFTLTNQELNPPQAIPEPRTEPIHHVWRRLMAPKRLMLHQVGVERDAAAKEIAKLAADRHKDANVAVLVFVRTLEEVAIVQKELTKTKREIVLLTGTMRGKERDELVERPIFKRFLKDASRGETVYLVCTSAGEVGIDISADHMICDLSTFDSMAQRLGRVNRYGDRTDTRIDVVHPTWTSLPSETDVEAEKKKKKPDVKVYLNARRRRTLELLNLLEDDASPKALHDLKDRADLPCTITDAFAPTPTILSTTDILFDAWALTSIRDKMPGRPEVGPYLHGIADELPQTTIAWRAELDLLANDADPRKKLQAIFVKHRIRPHETVTISSRHVIKFFKAVTEKREILRNTRVAILFSRQLLLRTIGELIDNDGLLQADPTLVLPASFGYLDDTGMLSADANPAEPHADAAPRSLDIADHEGYEPTSDVETRMRVLIERNDDGWTALRRLDGKPMPDSIKPNYPKSPELIDALRKTGFRVRLVQPIAFNDEGDAVRSLVALSPVREQQQAEEQPLDEHVKAVERAAQILADKLKLLEPFRSALLFAAKWHDEGKKADIWQRYIGGKDGQPPLGKSAKWCDPKKLCGYRHEFGSLIRIEHPGQHQTACVLSADPEVKDLALHLIAAHHGNARPHFSNSFDRDFSTQQCHQIHTAVIRRFADLERKYGRWGLAYLESLLRAADSAASAGLETDDETEDFIGGEA